MIQVNYLLILFLLLAGCTAENNENLKLNQCIRCHSLQHDEHHQQECVSCHKGQDDAQEKKNAHLGLVASPAHPDSMIENCTACHEEIVKEITATTHFTLKNSTNLFRKAFGAKITLENFQEVVPAPTPATGLELADDLLRRRCFRCHLYNKGDNYPSTIHGTGCAACHLTYEDGELGSHSFTKPSDQRCLSCHYGNYVGFDYYGRFEHDFNNEYRTPYTTRENYFRPYGVEFHQLKADIHKLKGMACIDCHTGDELMYGSENKLSCKSCHQQENFRHNKTLPIEKKGEGFIFTDRDGAFHDLPLLQHPVHFSLKTRVACQSCHAQWAFNDTGKHFFRTDSDDQNDWFNLFVQGSAEVERIIENNTDYDKDELLVQMSDKLTGQNYPGIWIKGFTQRRWESVELGYDEQGILTPMRPVLDYHLSWMDEDETVLFDSIIPLPEIELLLPYVPHTTGSAGIFYRQRLEQAMKKNSKAPASQQLP